MENHIITSHGYSNNEISLWNGKLIKLKTFFGHSKRVLFLSMSPCGNYLVSGAGDETLRFWKIRSE